MTSESGTYWIPSLRRRCPLLALSGHTELHRTCPLLGVKRTCRFALQMSAYDPKRTSPSLLTPFFNVASLWHVGLRVISKQILFFGQAVGVHSTHIEM